MKKVIRNIIKKILFYFPFALTRNIEYDRQTAKVIARVLATGGNTVDAGCHKGEIMDLFLKFSPSGLHYGFEPLPHLYRYLIKKYNSSNNIKIFSDALSNSTGIAHFNHVIEDPALSGLKKRDYNSHFHSEDIEVKTVLLDNLFPNELKLDLFKIDVEGGELLVLEGAKSTILKSKPIIIFEHGLGASEFYGATPEKVFTLLTDCGLKVSTMKRWLDNKPSFNMEEFCDQYYKKLNYYFIAYP